MSNINQKAIVEQAYDAIAPAYLAWSAPRPTTTRKAYMNKLLGLLPAGAKVLELGCGAGVPCTQQMVEHGLDVTGVDISRAQVELAREHVPKGTFIQGDMMDVSFENESFDAIVAFYSLFHLPGEEQGTMVKRMVGWLKPGGKLLFNLGTGVGDITMKDWFKPGVDVVSSGLGEDGNREMLKKSLEAVEIVEDEVAVEQVGGFDERFHWVWAVKGTSA